MTSIIFHIDVNSAFLSWSALKLLKEDKNAPDLRKIPSAVGGDRTKRRGVITAKSIPAKKAGVRTGEPVARALEKCPSLILVRSDFDWYRLNSSRFLKILRSYSPQVEQASIDEAYLDATALLQSSAQPKRDAMDLAQRIREEIRTSLGFTVNIGISTNKLLAKMASDFEKPDKTHTLWKEEIPAKLFPLPIGSLYGCGKKTGEKLRAAGISTIGDAAHTEEQVLCSLLGESAGHSIAQSSRGEGSAFVRSEREEARSYSNERTTPEDITRENAGRMLPPLLLELSAEVSRRMQKDGVFGSTLAVLVKTDSFRRFSRQTSLPRSVNEEAIIRRTAEMLLRELLFGSEESRGLFDRGDRIRLVGIRMSMLDSGMFRQVLLEDFLKEQKQRTAQQKAEAVRKEQEAKAREQLRRKEECEREKRMRRCQKKAKMEMVMLEIRKKYGEELLRKGAGERK